MKVCLLHGYFLSDSGSGIYVRELARAYVKAGHEVALVCQESKAEDYEFIDRCFEEKGPSGDLVPVFDRKPLFSGRCSLYRPFIGKRLLTYVPNDFNGFDCLTFQEAPEEYIAEYISHNVRGLIKVASHFEPDMILSNHVVMQPSIAKRAFAGKKPYSVTVHGSALNFSVKKDQRLLPCFTEGLKGAELIVCLSGFGVEELESFCNTINLDFKDKTFVVSPGVNIDTFTPAGQKSKASAMLKHIYKEKTFPLLLFSGRLLPTKGIHLLVSSMLSVLKAYPDAHLVVCGEGPLLEPLKRVLNMLKEKRFKSAARFLKNDPLFAGGSLYPLHQSVEELEIYFKKHQESAVLLETRIMFLGHLPHESLSAIYSLSDISLTPSIFPEAFGLVSIEALSSGSLPLATYHTGLQAPMNLLRNELKDDAFTSLTPGSDMLSSLPEMIRLFLENYPTRDPGFREKLHRIAAKNFSWESVAQNYLKLFEC